MSARYPAVEEADISVGREHSLIIQAASGMGGNAERLFGIPEAEAEFVPEPGSIVLLGNGLVGLAGYGALRWRTRE